MAVVASGRALTSAVSRPGSHDDAGLRVDERAGPEIVAHAPGGPVAGQRPCTDQ